MSEQTWILILSAVLVLLAVLLMHLYRRTGTSGGKVIYQDLSGKPVPALFSRQYGLAGKPDMLLQEGRKLIPVELKSGWAPREPRPMHVMQLACYCLLVEEKYGVRPPYGILRYRDKAYQIPYTGGMRSELLRTMDAMRREEPEVRLPSRCRDRSRCQHCGYAKICADIWD